MFGWFKKSECIKNHFECVKCSFNIDLGGTNSTIIANRNPTSEDKYHLANHTFWINTVDETFWVLKDGELTWIQLIPNKTINVP